MTQLARSRVGLPVESGETFDAFSRWYETHHTVKHKGARRERQILEHLRQRFGPFLLHEIRPARWTEYETERTREGAAVGTIGRELAVMKGVLNAAVGEHLDVNPLANVKRKRPKLKPKRTITADEEPTFLEALARLDAEIHDMYVVGVGTLLRQDDLLQLRRREHRGDRLVVDTKTGPHVVPLDGPTALQRRAAKVLRRRMPQSPAGYFFPAWRARFAAYEDPGHPRVQFLRIVKLAATAASLPWGLQHDGIVWHTATRASGATRLLRERQVDIRTVQLIGGWRSLDQMAEYLGLDLQVFTQARKAKRA
jgi:integrase